MLIFVKTHSKILIYMGINVRIYKTKIVIINKISLSVFYYGE